MTFGEKLEKLTEGRNRQEVSESAGLPPNAISDYINKGHLPRLDKALALADALRCDLTWLADDAQGFPPPERPLQRASTDELRNELGRRMHEVGRQILPLLHRAEKEDWIAVGKQIAECDPSSPLPRALESRVAVRWQIEGLADLLEQNYDPTAHIEHETDRAVHEAAWHDPFYGLIGVHDRARYLADGRPGFEIVYDLLREFWPEVLRRDRRVRHEPPHPSVDIDAVRKRYIRALDRSLATFKRNKARWDEAMKFLAEHEGEISRIEEAEHARNLRQLPPSDRRS